MLRGHPEAEAGDGRGDPDWGHQRGPGHGRHRRLLSHLPRLVAVVTVRGLRRGQGLEDAPLEVIQ